MPEFFDMLTTIARRRKAGSGSPFASVKRTEKWLKTLPADSDYDRHHALVEGLERFNAEHAPATLSRMKSLLKLEEAGLPLQESIVEQYVRNQASFRLARQALWRESWMFWSLLAEAWYDMLKHAYRNPGSEELKPHVADFAARTLRYIGLVMRWDYHQTRSPSPSAWRRLHKIYRLVERGGHVLTPVRIDAKPTHCAREYTLVVLLGLVHPLGYRTQEIESIAELIERFEPLPLPDVAARRQVHTHMVDLTLSEGASMLEPDWVEGRRLRYLALGPLVAHLRELESDASEDGAGGLAQQVASLIERGGIRRNLQRTNRFGRVWVAAGMDNILAALAQYDGDPARSGLEPWMLRDESPEGMGFALPEATALPHGRLVAVSWDPSENVWQLLAIRWNREEDNQHLVGAQRLSRHPKRVEIHFEPVSEGNVPEKTWAVYMPMTHPDQGVSNLLIPQSHYRLGASLMLRDGDVLYRLRLGEVMEGHEGWLRVGMDVLGREQFVAAA